MIKVSRSIKELSYKINELQKAYRDYKNEEIGIDTIARDLNVSKEEIIIAMESAKQVESFEKKIYSNDDDGISMIETLKEENQEEKMINNILLSELINKLDDREKQIIVLRYYRGKTQSEIAKILGITQVQVSRIERKILASMKRKIIC